MSFRTVLLSAACVALTALQPVYATEPAKPKPPTSAEVRREINEAMDAISRYSAAKRDEALERASKALSDLDAQLEEREKRLRKDWSEMSERARQEAVETTNELKRHRNELAEWYGGMKHGSQKAWGEVRSGFSRAYAELKNAWERSGKD